MNKAVGDEKETASVSLCRVDYQKKKTTNEEEGVIDSTRINGRRDEMRERFDLPRIKYGAYS